MVATDSLQLLDGEILFNEDTDEIAMHEDCCCGGEQCEHCTSGPNTTPAEVKVTLSDVAEGTDGEPCADWDDWNAEWVLEQDANTCLWKLTEGLPCGATLIQVTLETFGPAGSDIAWRCVIEDDDNATVLDVFWDSDTTDPIDCTVEQTLDETEDADDGDVDFTGATTVVTPL